jgi:hypothetical protein
VNYGSGKTIFIEHMNDLFEDGVSEEWISKIIDHCRKYPLNEYVFQTKNPRRAIEFRIVFPPKVILGTTIESNRSYPMLTYAPPPGERARYLTEWKGKKFITIEPILDFDVKGLVEMVVSVKPDFVNIGADSKGSGLPEPPKEKIIELVTLLTSSGVTIQKKENLERILEK